MKQILGILTVILFMTAPVSAQDFCEGNFDFDQDQDGSDAFTFKTDFGRSIFSNPCPPDGPAPVQKTGQTISYNTSDDGDLEKGVAWPNPRFTNNGDGTVRDNLTGLIWLRDANCSLFNGPQTWDDAVNIIVQQLEDGYCGLSDDSSAGDWRLPNRRELLSLLDDGYYNPALSNTAGTGQWSEGDPFYNVQSHYYWSSTTYAAFTGYGWYVYMGSGDVYHSSGINSYYVWPVRGGH